MSDKSWVDKDHYRKTNDSGTRSWLYEADHSIFGTDKCVEVADHHKDGTTDAYEPDGSITGILFNDGKGKHK